METQSHEATPTVAPWLVEQYTVALNENYNIISCQTNQSNLTITYTNSKKTKSYLVTDYDLNSCKCSCYKSQSMLLPCRHIFFARISKKLNVFESEMVPKRLLASLDVEAQSIKSHTGSSHATIENLNSLTSFENINKKMDRKEKYEALFRPAQELCNTLKDLPMDQFRDKLNIFLYVKELFEKRIDFIPTILSNKNYK